MLKKEFISNAYINYFISKEPLNSKILILEYLHLISYDFDENNLILTNKTN